MNLLRPVEWEEVFLEWNKNEGQNPDWLALAKQRGHETWADWRVKGYARRFACEKAEWGFYEIENPSEVVGGWFGGPFRSWIERNYEGGKTKSFAEIATQTQIGENPTIRRMIANYPSDTMISALMLSDGRIFVIEGMHRAAALARMAAEGNPYPGKLIFAIGKSTLAELSAVGKND